jgi:type IV secretion system protein VirB1
MILDSSTLAALVLACAPAVHPQTAAALVDVESAKNPYAIGVVGGALDRQPRNLGEAVNTAKALQATGWNFSLGVAQINQKNLRRVGLTIEEAFEPCANLGAMQTVLSECYARATTPNASRRGQPQRPAVRMALSCYYSGNFTTGFAHGYVAKAVRAAAHRP